MAVAQAFWEEMKQQLLGTEANPAIAREHTTQMQACRTLLCERKPQLHEVLGACRCICTPCITHPWMHGAAVAINAGRGPSTGALQTS